MKNFIEVYNSRSNTWDRKSFDIKKENRIIKDSIKYLNDLNNSSDSGHTNLIIVMEELSELSQRVSKYLRGMRTEEDRLLLMEEMADVDIGLSYIMEIVGINRSEVLLSKDIKLERLDLKMKENRMK